MPATTMRRLTSDHPKIEQFLRLWHENGRAQFQRSMPSHNYDTQQRKIAKDRRQYILLKSGNDRVFLVQRSTQYVYQVDDYGRRGKFLNTLDALIEPYRGWLGAREWNTADSGGNEAPDRPGARMAQAQKGPRNG